MANKNTPEVHEQSVPKEMTAQEMTAPEMIAPEMTFEQKISNSFKNVKNDIIRTNTIRQQQVQSLRAFIGFGFIALAIVLGIVIILH